MKPTFWLCALVLTGCGGAVQPSFLVRPEQHVETQPLPPDPATEPLPPNAVTNQDWVEPYEAGGCTDAQGRILPDAPRPCPDRSGIAVGETRAMRDGMFRLRYREMRVQYEADRQVWAAHRTLYETQLRRADEHVASLRPNWFERNALPLGLLGGFLLGTVTTIAVYSILPYIP